jgi:hypothetical protein
MVWLSILLKELNGLQDHYCITALYLLPIARSFSGVRGRILE